MSSTKVIFPTEPTPNVISHFFFFKQKDNLLLFPCFSFLIGECKPQPWFSLFTLVSNSRTYSNETRQPNEQHVENIVSITFLGLSELSQSNMNVQAVYLWFFSLPICYSWQTIIKANNRTEHDFCLWNLSNHVPQRNPWFQSFTREFGISSPRVRFKVVLHLCFSWCVKLTGLVVL